MYYIDLLDDNITIDGIYSDANANVPSTALSITDEEFKLLREHSMGLEGYTHDGTVLIERLDTKKDIKKKEVNEWAHDVIIVVYPEWKQRNMSARFSELQNIRIVNGTLSASEITEENTIRDVWTWIVSIRTESNRVNDMVNNAITVDDVAFDEFPIHPDSV